MNMKDKKQNASFLKKEAKKLIKDGINDAKGDCYEYSLCKNTIEALIWLAIVNRKYKISSLHEISSNEDLLYKVYNIGYQYSLDVGGIYGCHDVLLGLKKIKDENGRKFFDCRTKEFKEMTKGITCLETLRNTGVLFKCGYENEFNENQQEILKKIENEGL